MLQDFFNFILSLTADMGYLGVGFLMTIESSFLPFPSEIVVPPAAYLASKGEMNVYLVVVAGVIGSILGAIINYFIAFYLGRPIIYKLSATKFARFIFISPEKLDKAEKYFLKNSNSATFFGRLIPVIRQLVSLPAGFSKMNFSRFVLLTALGSFIWVSILAALGYFLGANQDKLHTYYSELKWVFLALGTLYILFKLKAYKIFKKKV